MLVPTTIRECVCFAYAGAAERSRPVGTAFFLGIPMGSTDRFGCVVVTAFHVVAKARERGELLSMRVNTPTGGFELIAIPDYDWVVPDQSEQAVDVAVAVWPHDRSRFAFRFTTTDDALTEEVIDAQVVGPGDEVFLPGLFVNHHGTRQNVPIVRVGNIAAMPVEPVRTKMLGAIDAYLVESRSLGGLSGSPVFLNMGFVRHTSCPPGAELRLHTRQRTWYLLGVMHGHWEADVNDVEMDAAGTVEYVNMGIAVVTPIEKVLALLQTDPLRSTFEEMRQRTEAAAAAGLLSR
jgi:hypothetical protein